MRFMCRMTPCIALDNEDGISLKILDMPGDDVYYCMHMTGAKEKAKNIIERYIIKAHRLGTTLCYPNTREDEEEGLVGVEVDNYIVKIIKDKVSEGFKIRGYFKKIKDKKIAKLAVG